MPKMKSHKGTLRRIRITAKNKIKHKRSGTSHLMSHMSGSKVRSLRKPLTCAKPVAKKMEKVLGLRLNGR